MPASTAAAARRLVLPFTLGPAGESDAKDRKRDTDEEDDFHERKKVMHCLKTVKLGGNVPEGLPPHQQKRTPTDQRAE